MKSLSHVRLFATQWTVAYQASPSMGFYRQEYWCGLPLPSPGDLPDPGIEPGCPALEADTLTSEQPGKPCILNIPFAKYFPENIIAFSATISHHSLSSKECLIDFSRKGNFTGRIQVPCAKAGMRLCWRKCCNVSPALGSCLILEAIVILENLHRAGGDTHLTPSTVAKD